VTEPGRHLPLLERSERGHTSGLVTQPTWANESTPRARRCRRRPTADEELGRQKGAVAEMPKRRNRRNCGSCPFDQAKTSPSGGNVNCVCLCDDG
jgi:hypothetical protein